MNHSTNSNDQQLHYEELFRLLQECNPHLVALGYPPLNLSYADIASAKPDSDEKGCEPNATPEAVQNAIRNLAPGEYCILSSEDFNSLMDDLSEMAESIDWLCRIFQEKEHLAKTLIGIAAKLDTSREERTTVKRILESLDETAERWEEIKLTPLSSS